MYEFSLTSLIWGLVITVAGAAFTYFYKVIADNFGGGPGVYAKYKLYGVIAVIFGILMLFNIPQFLLTLVVEAFFGK